MKIFMKHIAAFMFLLFPLLASADNTDDSFHPYSTSSPSFEGLSAGITINAEPTLKKS